MNTNVLAIVKQIVAEQGMDIFDNPQRLKAFFADLARDEAKPQKNAFIKCVELTFPHVLKNASAAERAMIAGLVFILAMTRLLTRRGIIFLLLTKTFPRLLRFFFALTALTTITRLGVC